VGWGQKKQIKQGFDSSKVLNQGEKNQIKQGFDRQGPEPLVRALA
jgi:hypothetical protein